MKRASGFYSSGEPAHLFLVLPALCVRRGCFQRDCKHRPDRAVRQRSGPTQTSGDADLCNLSSYVGYLG
jgi:hypothetical protein